MLEKKKKFMAPGAWLCFLVDDWGRKVKNKEKKNKMDFGKIFENGRRFFFLIFWDKENARRLIKKIVKKQNRG